MSKRAKLIAKILSGRADATIRFDDLCKLLTFLGFEKRVRGDHFIFTREGIEEILNFNPRRDWRRHIK